MKFSNYVNENKLSLSYIQVDIDQLISFLEENTHIKQLSVNCCNVNNQGAKALANSENLKNLTTLNLNWNKDR